MLNANRGIHFISQNLHVMHWFRSVK